VTRVGLVLGAGGAVGHAFHAGALAALQDETGWDARDADVLVGTSAGSVVAALLRAGFGTRDLYAEARGERPAWSARRRLHRSERHASTIPATPPLTEVFNLVASPRLLARAIAAPWTVRPGAAAAAVLPVGSVSTDPLANRLRPLIGARWPDRDLRICAVALDRGQRVVFGPDQPPPPDLVTAVTASCAIPGFFAPVSVNGTRYVDGGVHSPTNADLLADLGLDLVIVSSPMSHTGRWPAIGLDTVARGLARAALWREERQLRGAGTKVIVMQPSHAVRAAMGPNPMQSSHRERTAECAYAAIRRWLAWPGPRTLLEDADLARPHAGP
jgi:NTE family protein